MTEFWMIVINSRGRTGIVGPFSSQEKAQDYLENTFDPEEDSDTSYKVVKAGTAEDYFKHIHRN